MPSRLSRNDVADLVDVERPEAVRDAVAGILGQRYPGFRLDLLDRVFADMAALFSGAMPGYRPCDTLYHDLRHTLDVTLAMVRLIDGYERSCPPEQRLGAERALLGVILALFHDAGYMREISEPKARKGAEYTLIHVSRSAAFLAAYLPRLGLGRWVPVASQLVHFTGHEVTLEDIRADDPLDRILGALLGTADLIAQMSDRLYLEKCRDYLYDEFVLGGIATQRRADGEIVYASPADLLRKTPEFYRQIEAERLDGFFSGAHRYAVVHFGGEPLYQKGIARNLRYLERLIPDDRLDLLRRVPVSLSQEALRSSASNPDKS